MLGALRGLGIGTGLVFPVAAAVVVVSVFPVPLALNFVFLVMLVMVVVVVNADLVVAPLELVPLSALLEVGLLEVVATGCFSGAFDCRLF